MSYASSKLNVYYNLIIYLLNNDSIYSYIYPCYIIIILYNFIYLSYFISYFCSFFGYFCSFW